MNSNQHQQIVRNTQTSAPTHESSARPVVYGILGYMAALPIAAAAATMLISVGLF